LALSRSNTGEARKVLGWNHVRVSVVVPIGIIVAVAILCVVVAVLGSARRADEVALDNERQLFTRSLRHHAERVLREVEGIATSEASIRGLRAQIDVEWVQNRLGLRLQTLFDQDFVFVADAADHFIYALLGNRSVDPTWFNSIKPDLMPALDLQRGRLTDDRDAVVVAGADHAPAGTGNHRVVRLQAFLGRPAIVTAVAVAARSDTSAYVDVAAPVVLSVKFIDEEVLAEIASRLQLRNLHNAESQPVTPAEYVFSLSDGHGQTIGRFAWIPQRPGAEIVNSVLPFIAIALAGFAFLATVVYRHMRRTAATIAAGETRLRHLALHDPLCGLPNRIYFSERLDITIENVRNGRAPAAVLYIDLDHFKDVNDTLGHPIGDELIRGVTQRLTRTLRGDDLVARIGGDEFAVITTAGCDQPTLQVIADRLIAALCAPYSINSHTVGIGASVGIAIITENTASAADVMRHADMALYRAKNEGRNRACIYDDAMNTDLTNRKLVENDLRAAIENNELRVDYQPIVNNSGEMMVGVEALCRWTHPVRGEIHPSEFIPIAENSGLIIALGEWVLRRACLDAKAWAGISLAVNVSPLQFRRTDFVDMVERILSETDFNQTRLELEVTESTLLGNVDTTELAMFRLKALGVRLALDDFGTGYSSLLYLRRFPFDKLKIDRSFVHSIEQAADAAAIVHAIVSLGRGLGMKVTAEGVESAEQHLFLRAAGVHFMQGFRFGRPCSAADISSRLAFPASFRIADDTIASLALAG
jgi:diguanylate cyclase